MSGHVDSSDYHRTQSQSIIDFVYVCVVVEAEVPHGASLVSYFHVCGVSKVAYSFLAFNFYCAASAEFRDFWKCHSGQKRSSIIE